MKNKRILAVLGLSVVGALSLTAWVVLKAPAANLSWPATQPTTEQMYAEGHGELPPPRRAVAAGPEPTSADFYAAGGGTFSEPATVKPAVRFAQPTSADLYAARGGVWD